MRFFNILIFLSSVALQCWAEVLEHQPEFLCPRKGLLPDPFNCRVFHFCEQADVTSLQYVCPEGSGFNGLNCTVSDNFCSDKDSNTVHEDPVVSTGAAPESKPEPSPTKEPKAIDPVMPKKPAKDAKTTGKGKDGSKAEHCSFWCQILKILNEIVQFIDWLFTKYRKH